MRSLFLPALCLLILFSCAKERPYLSGHIKRAADAVMVPCDPYGLNKLHTCIVFAAAFRENLYVFDASAGEMVLMNYFPLKIRVGRVTDELVTVVSKEARTPFLLAVDHASAKVYPVRLFPTDKEKSFSTPQPTQLAKNPFAMAAMEASNKIIGLLTYPNDGGINIVAFNQNTGAVDETITAKSIKFGTKPSHVAIDRQRKVAVFSDAQESNLHVLDLSNIEDVLTAGAAHTVKSIPLKVPADRFQLSIRDFGAGSHVYAAVMNLSGNDIELVNIDSAKSEATVTMSEYPTALYFPDQQSATCCSNKPAWFSVVTIKGKLDYIVINKNDHGALALEKFTTTTDLTSENNLSLGKLFVRKIIGGYVEPDKSADQEKLCANNRQTFYIAAYGNSRSYLHVEPVEVEAHAYSCEGDASAMRFGVRAH